ncbi:MAG TPA: DUF5916 domain-containing protein [Clostridia bacterium]|nr:DUF5916 domain-containing protein [Clostridia bacterium]
MKVTRGFIVATVLLFIVFIAFALPTPAYSAETPAVHIPRVKLPPTLKQFIDGTPREAEGVVTDFIQREPHDGDPVTEPTTAYLSYDDANLYVAFVCKSDPSKLRASIGKREDVFSDDMVMVLLDTFHDHRRAYEFFSNPHGIQADGVAADGQNDDMSWDTVWHSEGRIVKDGYVVLITIPFRSLRFNRTPVQEWGICLARSIPQNNEVSFWPHITRKIAGFGTQMGHLDGMKNVSPGRNMQFIPYTSFAASRSLDPQAQGGAAYRRDYEPRSGLDSKIVIKDALTLDVTVNPDFSQVESDEPQTTINQRFEVFFEEKRPFFLENSDFFKTPETLFFSRRIADPEFGARLTGRIGGWSVAALTMDDRAAGRTLSLDDAAHGERAKIAIGRVQRDIGRASHIGLMVTSRDFGGSSNRVFSLDTRTRLGKHWTVTGQAIRSYDTDLRQKDVAGNSFFAAIERSGRDLKFSTEYWDRSPDLRAPLGYISRTDVRWLKQEIGYFWHPKKGNVLWFGPFVSSSVIWDHKGTLQEWEVEPEFEIELPRSTELSLERSESFEKYRGIGFRQHSTHYYFGTEWLKWLSVSLSGSDGTGINYYPAIGLPTLSKSNDKSVTINLRPTSRLRVTERYIYWRLGTLDSAPGGSRPIFNNHIVRTKVHYQFTPRLSVRTILDYNAVLPNPLLVDSERAKKLTGDVLFTYMINPGTALYVGYTDVYDNLRLENSAPGGLMRSNSPTTPTGRQVFVKLSYLFRF